MTSLPFERGIFAVPLLTTTSKLPSERALNRHKTVTSRKFQDTPTTLGRCDSHSPSNIGLCFSREMAVATIGPFQMLRSLCVIDTNFKILRQFLLKLLAAVFFCVLCNTVFLKLWSADHKWSSGSALVVLLD
jgi:hypothetical protein